MHSGFAPACLAFVSLRGLPSGGGPDRVPQETRHRHIININIIMNNMVVSRLFRAQDFKETRPRTRGGLPGGAAPEAKYRAFGRTPRAFQKSRQGRGKEVCAQG